MLKPALQECIKYYYIIRINTLFVKLRD